jgi:hypothetical protein
VKTCNKRTFCRLWQFASRFSFHCCRATTRARTHPSYQRSKEDEVWAGNNRHQLANMATGTTRDIELQRQRRSHASEIQGPGSCIELQLLDGVEIDHRRPTATSRKVCLPYICKVSSLTRSGEKLLDTVTPLLRYGNSTVQNQRSMTRHSWIVGWVTQTLCSFL